MSDSKPQAQKPGGKKKQNRGLGRGLSALIGDAAPKPVAVAPPQDQIVPGQGARKAADGGLRYVGIDELKAGAFQPRKNFAKEELDALAASVEKSGVLQPLLVRPAGDGFEIIAGERRWRAAQQARLHQVPVIVQPVNNVTALEIGLVENVQRADLNPVEEAEGYQRLIDEFAYTQAELAETIGKSRSHIANLLRLSGAPSAIKQALIDGVVSMGHARALLGLQNPEKHAAALIKQIVKSGMSVRAVEKLVAAQGTATDKKPTGSGRGASEKSADTRQLEKQLADALGLNVALDDKGKKGGELRIAYKTLEQLDALMARLLRG
ncbi:MAG: ParB/RepB/Spo0J family partition protein [Parvibaculales bacterium]